MSEEMKHFNALIGNYNPLNGTTVFEYYLHRGNKFYFRALNAIRKESFVIHCSDSFADKIKHELKYGHEYILS